MMLYAVVAAPKRIARVSKTVLGTVVKRRMVVCPNGNKPQYCGAYLRSGLQSKIDGLTR
jgi:hypothetical protein